MNASSSKSHFQEIDLWIRSGDHERARQALLSIKPADVFREQLVELADFGRRVRDPMYSLRVLGKVMRSHLEKTLEAHPKEVLAYSKALVKLGFFEEARRWISALDVDQNPEVQDVFGRMAMVQWNYTSAARSFSLYLKNLPPDSYLTLVTQLNLAASFIGKGEFGRSEEVLNQLLEKARAGGHQLISANCNELLAQASILNGSYQNGLRYLDESVRLLGSGSSVYHFYAEKWKWISEWLNEGSDSQVLKVRGWELARSAHQKRYWEDVRDIEFRIHSKSQDFEGLTHLLFGTIHESYRQRIRDTYSGPMKFPTSYEWKKGIGRRHKEYSMEELVKGQGLLPSVFKVLTMDFYRPISLGFLFSKIYSGEYFDPHHSPARMYRNICRLRKALPSESGIGVHWDSEGIQLTFEAAVKFPVTINREPVPRDQQQVVSLRSLVERRWFTTGEVAQKMQVSQRTAQELLKRAQKRYKLEKTGQGRATRYRFAG